MALGGGNAWKGYLLGVVVVVTVLATTGVWNPFPKLWTWVNTSDPIAAGSSRWQVQIGGTPQSIALAGDAIIVEYRTSVEAYGLAAGVKLWTNDADWAQVAGSGANTVVVTGRLLTKGYLVLNPHTGATLRTETAASAVWAYSDAIVDLHCGKHDDCELTAWNVRTNKQLWKVNTGGIGFVLNAANPDLPDTRRLSATQVHDEAAGPPPLPGLFGLPTNGTVQLVDTAVGKVVGATKPAEGQRIAVAGDRVLTITGTARDGTCYYSVQAVDPPSTEPIWHRDGLNLRTADDGSGCKQSRNPVGGADVVLGVDPVGHEELISAHDGRTLWRGEPDEHVLAVDDGYAVIRSADQKTVRGFSFATGKTAWKRPAGAKVSAALTPYATLVVTEKPNEIVAVLPRTGAVLADVRTEAKVFAVGAGGMIAASGRNLAYLPWR